MRLLNTTTLRLKEFIVDIPPYAILSHTWGDPEEEVLFKDIEKGKAQRKKGFKKVAAFCKLALADEYKYCWIDSCCIDKSSSAELSEAINSMYSYYQKSSRCYVYLNKKMQGRHLTIEELHSTRWITRGWTLQEMLAPSVVHFYDVRWMFCGDAQDLKEQLEAATGIETSLYDPRESVHSWKYTIATKMSWASKRVTTRPEDMAYCLFGLFNVHLPPLYGEGQAAAFRRIQEEIIKKSMDLSFLVWELEERDARWAGALALSPKAFQGCLVDAVYSSFKLEPFHITNKGLRVTLPLIKINKESLERKFEEYIMVLPNCRKRSHPEGLCSGVRVAVNSRQDVFYRYRSSGMARAQIVSVSVQMMAEAAVRTFYLATN